MEIKFDMVRIGGFRKNHRSEILLRQNADLLMNDIRTLLLGVECGDGKNKEAITLIIPAKGFKVKFRLQDFREDKIRALVKKNFSRFAYHGKLDTILDNVNNLVFR
jgi:hypothetical protein